MRCDPPLSIAAATVWLPPLRETADEAIAAGRLDVDTAVENGYLAVTVSDELSPPEMAARAAGSALAAADWDPATVGLVVHAWTYYQGHDFWSPPHFVAHGMGARRAIPIGVRQMCNGGAAAIEISAALLLADPSVGRAVVTTADRFAPPVFDRWSGDRGAAYGDGATALLLTGPAEPAPLRLLASASTAVPELEAMHRGDNPFGTAPRSVTDTVQPLHTMRQFLAAGGGPLLADAVVKSVHAVLASALAQATLDGDDPRLRYVALPRLGRTVLDADFHAVVASHTSARIIELGRDTGHLGAGDAAANLATMHAEGMLAPGECAILLSVGAGFTWSAVVVKAA